MGPNKLCFIVFLSFWYACSVVSSIEIIDSSLNTNNVTEVKFPPDFLFGASTSAFQIEGGWNVNGKGPSVWDTLTHNHPELIDDHSNADVGPDSYNLYEKDIQALKETKVNFYRFSISWARILPTGEISSLNNAGLAYYDKLINRLLEEGIEPMVTMHHYDTPQALQDEGGLLNLRMIQYFEQYARVLFTHFGDRVKWWVTFNEPVDLCIEGYGIGRHAPLISLSGVGEYYCMDTVIRAHATVYRLYQNSFYSKFKGKIGMSFSTRFFFSATNDTDIVDRGMEYWLGWAAHAIYSNAGGYPPILVEDIARNSVREGRAWSRLPLMNEKWKSLIRGSADFLGLNYYTSRYAEIASTPQGTIPSWTYDTNLSYTVNPKWPVGKSTWLYSAPEGFRGLMNWIKDNYNNVEVIVTENGWSDDGEVNDIGRITYLQQHLQELLKAVLEDGCNVTGYTFWSIIDNFEWIAGYTERFGLYSINMNSTDKERKPKKSASFYREVIETRTIPEEDYNLNIK